MYLLALPREEYQILSKSSLLRRAHAEGKKLTCAIEFMVERHDDAVLVRQSIRQYKTIRTDIAAAYARLNLKHGCADKTLVECADGKGASGAAAREFLRTRKILNQKLAITPLYRIGTLYLYPKKDQCVLPTLDWYVENTVVNESEHMLPFEAAEEIELIFRNLETLRLWD